MSKQKSIEEIIKLSVEAGRMSAGNTSRDAFKSTEKRLYAFPVLKIKLKSDIERLEEIKKYGPRERSKGIGRFMKSGSRLSKEEILEAIIIDSEAVIDADSYEIETMENALKSIENDEYFITVSGRYFDNLPDEAIAQKIPCDTSTVWRNRKRLVQKLAVLLYGVDAVK